MLACSVTRARISRVSNSDFYIKVKILQVEPESPVVYLLCSTRTTENLFCCSSLVGGVSVFKGRGTLYRAPVTYT